MVALRTNSMHDIELRDVQLTLTKIYLRVHMRNECTRAQ